jgi:hypothetical protein
MPHETVGEADCTLCRDLAAVQRVAMRADLLEMAWLWLRTTQHALTRS